MNAKVTYGLWYDFRNPQPWRMPFEAFYAERLTQIAAAEKMGFESVWLTEHHFCDDGYTPSPLVICANVAARTETLRLGTNLMLLPIADPVRVAEDAATLSLLSGGRFDLGVGLGYREVEFEQFQRKISHRPSLAEEGIEIIRRAWRGEAVNFTGKRFKVGDLRITPAPEQAPKILLGGMAPPAIDRVARVADGFLCTGGLGLDIYCEALERHGKPLSAGNVILGCWAIRPTRNRKLTTSVSTCSTRPTSTFAGAPSARRSRPRRSARPGRPSITACMNCGTPIRRLRGCPGCSAIIR